MRTVFRDPRPAEVDALLERRHMPFYAAHGVDELLVVDPDERSVSWMALADGEYRVVAESRVLDLSVRELAALLDWD